MCEIIPSEDRRSFYEKPLDALPPESSLCIGQYGVWEVQLKNTEGVFEYSEFGEIERENIPTENIFSVTEGQEITYELTTYERSSRVRALCIFHHGISCKVCDINFENIYDEIGTGFIHVHHITPISQQGGEYQVNPVTDLVPLCPNCHAMIHRRNPPFSVAELKNIIVNRGARIF